MSSTSANGGSDAYHRHRGLLHCIAAPATVVAVRFGLVILALPVRSLLLRRSQLERLPRCPAVPNRISCYRGGPTMDRHCPCCLKGIGLVLGISALPDSPGNVRVKMLCQTCEHEWILERPEEPAKFVVPTPHRSRSSSAFRRRFHSLNVTGVVTATPVSAHGNRETFSLDDRIVTRLDVHSRHS
jgi:hypothetical protein